jgi:hypothetical protein
MPLATGAKTFTVPRNNLRRRDLSEVDVPKFVHRTIFRRVEREELVTYLVNLDNVRDGLKYRELSSLSFIMCL